LSAAALTGVFAFAAHVGRLYDGHTWDDRNDVFLADKAIHVEVINVEAKFKFLFESRAVEDEESFKEFILCQVLIIVLVNNRENTLCKQPRQLAVINEGDLVDAFLLVVGAFLQVVEDVLEVGNAHFLFELVVLHSFGKQQVVIRRLALIRLR